MGIIIEGLALFQIDANDAKVLEMYFAGHSLEPQPQSDRHALFRFQAGDDDKAWGTVDEILTKAGTGNRTFKNRVRRLGASPVMPEVTGKDVHADDLLGSKVGSNKIGAKIYIARTPTGANPISVQLQVTEKDSKVIFAVSFDKADPVPDDLAGIFVFGKVKRLATGDKATDRAMDLLDIKRKRPVPRHP